MTREWLGPDDWQEFGPDDADSYDDRDQQDDLFERGAYDEVPA